MEDLNKMSPYQLGEAAREEAIKYLILYLSKGTANEKRLAASAIKKLTEDFETACRTAIPFLVENLSDSHPQVRQYTLKSLCKFRLPTSALRVISDIAIGDKTEYNRRAAKEILNNAKNHKQEEIAVDIERIQSMENGKDKFRQVEYSNVFTIKEQDFICLINTRCGINFTEKQRMAVLHKEGPAIVLAVPGAGKTTVLLARTANLIINHGVNPANILSITFSKASALDMKSRYNSIFSSITSIGANFSTIHSFCYELIRKYSQLYNLQYTVIEDNRASVNKKAILKKCYSEFNYEQIDEDALEELINSIGYVKNMMFSKMELKEYSNALEINKFIEIYNKYENIKTDNKYLDYDDMLTVSYEILKEDLDLLQRYRQMYKYIQVDEGQDTSKIQHKILQLLAYPKNNIFIVADDDQSIYSFRGAYPKFLLEVDDLYENTKRFYIEENFRSTRFIVSLANEFIKKNKIRFNKELTTKNYFGVPVKIVKLYDEIIQADFLLDNLKAKNDKSSAILFRNNMTSISLADDLNRRGVAFYLKDYNRFFFKHFITEDLKAFLYFVIDNSNIEDFIRIYYKINSYLGKETVQAIKERYVKGKNIFYNIDELTIKDIQKQNLIKLKGIFFDLMKLSPVDIIDKIENELGYNKFLKENARVFGYSYEGLKAILINLKVIATRCSSIANFLARLAELEGIMEEATHVKEDKVVTLSTIHSSKGLEFNSVYIVDLMENIIPNRGSIDSLETGSYDNMEEERRLMYVAMTRARQNLCLITLDIRNGETVTISRFVKEINDIVNKKINE